MTLKGTLMKKAPAMVLALLVAAGVACGPKPETIGGIGLSCDLKDLVKKYGEPQAKQGPEFEPATGCLVWVYEYKAAGLEFVLCESQNLGKVYVRSVRAFEKSKARTGRGISIGSTRDRVRAAYEKIEEFSPETLGVEDEESWRAIYFTFDHDKVSEIILTEMPE